MAQSDRYTPPVPIQIFALSDLSPAPNPYFHQIPPNNSTQLPPLPKLLYQLTCKEGGFVGSIIRRVSGASEAFHVIYGHPQHRQFVRLPG